MIIPNSINAQHDFIFGCIFPTARPNYSFGLYSLASVQSLCADDMRLVCRRRIARVTRKAPFETSGERSTYSSAHRSSDAVGSSNVRVSAESGIFSRRSHFRAVAYPDGVMNCLIRPDSPDSEFPPLVTEISAGVTEISWDRHTHRMWSGDPLRIEHNIHYAKYWPWRTGEALPSLELALTRPGNVLRGYLSAKSFPESPHAA